MIVIKVIWTSRLDLELYTMVVKERRKVISLGEHQNLVDISSHVLV